MLDDGVPIEFIHAMGGRFNQTAVDVAAGARVGLEGALGNVSATDAWSDPERLARFGITQEDVAQAVLTGDKQLLSARRHSTLMKKEVSVGNIDSLQEDFVNEMQRIQQESGFNLLAAQVAGKQMSRPANIFEALSSGS